MLEIQAKIKGLAVNYKVIGEGNIPVVVLHGWGVSSDKYVPTAEAILAQDGKYRFYIPDLPGFGKSEQPQTAWKIDDYVDFTKEFIQNAARREAGFEPIKDIIEGSIIRDGQTIKKDGKKVVLIAHSFGGRIAIKYAVRYPEDIEKLCLTGAAGIKHPLAPRQELISGLSKAGKAFFRLPGLRGLEDGGRKMLYRISSEKDYGRASKRMKEVMRNALAEDLVPFLKDIKVPTFLIWGRHDHSTPFSDAQIMQREIPGSRLSIIEEGNHSAVYYRAQEFAETFLHCME